MAAKSLILRDLSGSVATIEVTAEQATLGRGEATVCVDEESVSRKHARLEQTQSGWFVEDLGSKHGSALNGLLVSEGERVRVHDGDELRLGSLRFRLGVTGAPFKEDLPEPRPAPTVPTITRDEFLTRGSLLLRLGDDDTMVREFSWQDFHGQYAPILRGFARKAGCPSDQLDDLVQEVMTNFFCAAERFEYDPEKGRFRGYLKTATIRTLMGWRNKRRGQVDWEPERFLEQAQQVDDAWDREWMEQSLERAILRVKPGSQMAESSWDAFELYGRRGMPLRDAAKQLGMQPEAVKKAKNRVAALVREELERLRLEEG